MTGGDTRSVYLADIGSKAKPGSRHTVAVMSAGPHRSCRYNAAERHTAVIMNFKSSPTPSEAIQAARSALQEQVIGQPILVERMLMALICGGHLLVEGAPGLAKTRAIKALANVIEGDFHRIQFTPDLLPSDVTGTEIFRQEDATFTFQRGPIFHNLILADEINRAPAKVQSALLEAMAEKQVSFGRQTFALPDLFMVMATQNPIEQEGTYPLPEAQLDRFLLQVCVEYPDREAEALILDLVRAESLGTNTPALATPLVSEQQVQAGRREMLDLYMAEPVQRYLIEIIMATRNPPADLAPYLEYGASPRGSISLDLCARANAWLQERDFVTPEDIQRMAPDVLRHRLIRSFEADAQGISSDELIDRLLALVPVP